MPDTSPLPDPVTLKKSPQEQLDAVDEEIATLEEKREELQYEVAKEKALEDTREEVREIHHDIQRAEEAADDAEKERDAAEEEADEAWRWLEEFGSHTATCLSGALVGSQKLHPLCTCGWNEVATRLERW